MESDRGIFIVIEGTDGSGKGTQFEILTKRLQSEGYDVATFDFPQYDQPSSYFVKQYLNGNYGTAEEVGPYTGSLFYALDRYEASFKIKEALTAGKIVLANRYVGSNMAHQGTKFVHAEERRGYFIWLDNLEFEMFRIPRPSISFVLRVPAKTAQNLVDQKAERSYTDKKRDLHEADLSHLERAVNVYDDMCQLFPKDFVRVDCVRDEQLLPIPAVHELVWQKVQPLLPPKPEKPATAAQAGTITDVVTAEISPYHIPKQLPDTVAQQYRAIIDQIFRLHGTMAHKLAADKVDSKEAEQLLWPALPIAATAPADAFSNQDEAVNKLMQSYLPMQHTDANEAVRLIDVWPRNEFDILPDMLYEYSNLPLNELRSEVAGWPYAKKADVFLAYTQKQPSDVSRQGSALEKVHYSWDVMSDYGTYSQFKQHCKVESLEAQELTPRYGYEVPQALDDAGLTEQFEMCFDLSLKLYSILQQEGFAAEAQYATLQGHRMRWKVTVNAADAVHIYKQVQDSLQVSPAFRELIQQIHDKVAETHPLLAQAAALAEQKA